uniref:Reverse transcriptase-rnase h-integrase n=1 Tax=Moniliophthora roreri TaxID=221103 RepID=A0A0W0FB76_MONRR
MPPPTDPQAMLEYPDPLSFSLLDHLRQQTDGNGYPIPTSATPGVLSPDSPPNLKLSRDNSLPLLVRPLNPPPTMPSFILTPLPILMSNLRSSRLITPPQENPLPRMSSTPVFSRPLRPQFHPEAKIIPAVGGEAPSEDVDEDVENQTLLNDNDALLTTSLRPLTPIPIPMTQLIDHVSALCADWNTILPGIACSTCVGDASKLSLGILLETALTSEGLAALHTEGLIRVQTLCRMITIITMNLTTTSVKNAEEEMGDRDEGTNLLFLGSDLWKVGRFMGLLLVEQQEVAGWQPAGYVPATPRLQDIDDMLDTSEDYNTELYGDGES